MSTLQVSNLHFESTGNNRIQYTGANAFNLVGGGTTVATVNTTAVNFPLALSINNITANSISVNTITGATLTDPIITGAIKEDIYNIVDGAAFEIDPSNGSIQLVTLGANRTPKATNFAAGESVTLMVDDGTAYTITWTDATFGTISWVGGSAPTLATTGYTVIELWKVATKIYAAYVGDVA